jgi:hypothetical protein
MEISFVSIIVIFYGEFMTDVTNFSYTKRRVCSCAQPTYKMDLFRQAIVLCSTVLALSALSGCAVRPLVLNHVADALAMPGQDLEDDILLAREASAF